MHDAANAESALTIEANGDCRKLARKAIIFRVIASMIIVAIGMVLIIEVDDKSKGPSIYNLDELKIGMTFREAWDAELNAHTQSIGRGNFYPTAVVEQTDPPPYGALTGGRIMGIDQLMPENGEYGSNFRRYEELLKNRKLIRFELYCEGNGLGEHSRSVYQYCEIYFDADGKIERFSGPSGFYVHKGGSPEQTWGLGYDGLFPS